MASLQGKVIAITGAASGMGREVARITAARGARLAVADVQKVALDALVEELKSTGTEIIGTVVNVASDKEVDAWIAATVQHFGRLDGAANLAGVEGKNQIGGMIVDQKNEEWDFVLAVNLTGLMYCLRAQARVMSDGGSIVNCSSVLAFTGRINLSAYVVSKHGVVGLTRTAAQELAPKGIRVNVIAP